MRQVPQELEDAANVDGASTVYVLVKIVFPLTKAAAAAVLLACAISRWNEFICALIYLTRREAYNIQMYIFSYSAQVLATELSLMTAEEIITINHRQMCASVIAMLVPIALTYPIVIKWIKRDITIGPVKA